LNFRRCQSRILPRFQVVLAMRPPLMASYLGSRGPRFVYRNAVCFPCARWTVGSVRRFHRERY
jgi:hypothetical protein